MKAVRLPVGGATGNRGFTLTELLVAVAVLTIVLLLVARMIGDTSKIWKNTSAKIDSFRDARLGFEMMTDELRQATMNTYWEYFNASGQTPAQWNATSPSTSFQPVAYGRQSELHFISGRTNLGLTLPSGTQTTDGIFFQWPGTYSASTTYTTLTSLLNATGFFVEFSPDVLPGNTAYVANGPPTSVLSAYQPQYRYRLMQFIQPTESLHVYDYSFTTGTAPNVWFTSYLSTVPLHAANVRIVANNVIALVVWPKKVDTANDIAVDSSGNPIAGDTALAPAYNYDSRLGLASGTAIPTGTWTPGTNPQPLQMNQMPPILQVAIVAIDEPSAKQLQGFSTTAPAPITNALAATNTGTGKALFTVAVDMDSDLAFLQTELATIIPHIQFQVFETTIAIRSAKFSNP